LASYQSPTLDDLLQREGFGQARVVYFEPTPLDRLARFLAGSAVAGLLMMIGLAGIFIELKSPGVGLPGAVGVVAIALYFLGSYMADLSSYVEWMVFALGVVLLTLEIYVIPGFGLAGLAGIACIAGALFLGLIDFSPIQGVEFRSVRLQMVGNAALTVLVAMIGLIPFLYVLARLLPSTPMFKRLMLAPLEAGAVATAEQTGLTSPTEQIKTGDRGHAVTDLHPTGVAHFAHGRVDVLTEGEFLNRNDPLEVIRVEGARILVRKARSAAPGRLGA
jgi:membrane-bound serine protease (ClpP class)